MSLKDYIHGQRQFMNPTQRKALIDIYKKTKLNESPSILDFELIGALNVNGFVKAQFRPIFDELGIDYEAFK